MAATNCWTLDIDFGQVGYRRRQQAFKLSLDARDSLKNLST